MMKTVRLVRGALAVTLAILIVACSGSPLALPMLRPSATPPGWLEYQRVEIPAAGLALDVPASWQQIESDWVWEPEPDSLRHVGLKWSDIEPPVEPEAAMLPRNAVTLSAEPIEMGWGTGQRYTVEVYAPAEPSQGAEATPAVLSVETHILIVVQREQARRVYDVYGSASTAGELATLEPVLWRMLSSAQPS